MQIGKWISNTRKKSVLRLLSIKLNFSIETRGISKNPIWRPLQCKRIICYEWLKINLCIKGNMFLQNMDDLARQGPGMDDGYGQPPTLQRQRFGEYRDDYDRDFDLAYAVSYNITVLIGIVNFALFFLL